ncbi:MAG: PadR family transcriptional regulator [Candidatus Odinarchaeota archaeon]
MPRKRFTPLKTFILGVMNTIPKPMSGYELISIANEWYYDHYINATNASFYYALKQLQREDFIRESGTWQEGNRPEKKIFRLTSKGRKEFFEQMKHFLMESQDFYFDIDATMPFITLFGSNIDREFFFDTIDNKIVKLKESLKHAEEGEKTVTSHFSYKYNPFNILPLKHWKLHCEAEIKWLEFFKERVESITDFKELFQNFVKKSIELNQEEKKNDVV